jgi:hypothetical protein
MSIAVRKLSVDISKPLWGDERKEFRGSENVNEESRRQNGRGLLAFVSFDASAATITRVASAG